MEIILNSDIPKLGYKGDVVTVKPGYARNYLIPQGFAVVANAANKKAQAEILKQQVNKLEKRKQDAQTLANKLESTDLTVKVKTGTSGKIFGSVTTLQVAHMLKEEGFDIDRRNISFLEPIKEVGTHTAQVECYKDIVADVKIHVQGDKVAE